MRACTLPERAFVVALLETGGNNQTLAAATAGIGGPNDAQRVAGSRLARIPRVQAAVREEADKRLRGGAILAASVLIEIASDRMHKDRFKAAESLLNRAGLMTETVQRHIIEDHRTDDELRDAIILMARKNHLDPATLLGKPLDKNVVDAEFTEVDKEEVSFEGLEDIL
jgi:phage terminase small subunit